MKYQVEYTPQAVEDLKGLSRTVRSLLYGWIEKNLVDCEDPRCCGSGDREGGRWRYQIGEYRILAEIQDGKIIILAVLAGLRRTANPQNGGVGKISAAPNVFLRSTLRQPVKAILLLTVIVLITFAFVTRSAEYLLVKQETERLESYYQAAGTIQSVVGDKWADTSEIIAYLESNPYVQLVNTYNHTSAVMEEEYCNADIEGTNPGKPACYFYFCGTLLGWDRDNFYFSVDTVLAGYPDQIQEGQLVTLFRPPVNSRLSEEDYSQLKQGTRYLAQGYYRTDAYPNCRVEVTDLGVRTTYAVVCRTAVDELFYPIPEGQEINWKDKDLFVTAEEIQTCRDVQRTLNIIPVKDMDALSVVQDTVSGIYLTDGRWLDSQDDAQNNKVCVINANLATLRDLELGDTVTLRLQDIPSCFGYLYNMSEIEDSTVLASAKTATDTYEIVGIYDYLGTYPSSAVRNFTYVPAAAVPGNFAMTNSSNTDTDMYEYLFEKYFGTNAQVFFPGEISFLLTSPESEAQFMAESRDDLARFGFEAVMADNGWANFQEAAVPMRQSSLLNAGIFSALLIVVFCLLAVLYYRIHRKEIAIIRALGVPSGFCTLQVSIPLLLLGFFGISAGGWLGWQYTRTNAAGMLSVLDTQGRESVVNLSGGCLAALWCIAFVLLFAVTIIGAVILLSRPVLRLFQNRTAEVKENSISAPVPQKAVSAVRQAVPVITPVGRCTKTEMQSGGLKQILQFVCRHILRSKLKSILSLLLAAGFTIGLAAIQLSIAKNKIQIDWLYENTLVEAELVQADTTQTISSGGFIRQDTIDALMESGYITDAYLEGDTGGAVIRYEDGMESGQAVYGSKENMENKTVRALGDEETFLSAAGSGSAVTITYFDGWDGSLFAKDWTSGQFPVVLPKAVYEQFCDSNMVGLFCKTFQVCEIAGYYEGDVANTNGETDPVLLPINAYRQMSNRLVYSKAHVTLNPSLNRELETFTQILTKISAGQRGAAALRAVIWDEELRLSVAPLENSIELMQVLYPITLVLSLLAAAGIAVLFVMTSAKEAAIMRVLGTSKLRSRMMLALQTAFTSIAGLLIGLFGVLLCMEQTRSGLRIGLLGTSVLCAALYLLAAILGSAVSASILTSRNPLELLQVKE